MKNIKELKQEANNIIKGQQSKLFVNIFIIFLFFLIINIILGYISKLCGYPTKKVSGTIILFNEYINIKNKTTAGHILDVINGIIFVMGSFSVTHYILNYIRKKEVKIIESLKFVYDNLLNVLILSTISLLSILVGSLFLIIPGIVIGLCLALVIPIYVDNPNLNVLQVISKSFKLMFGYKMKFLTLICSFALWIILCLLIFPLIYVGPYILITLNLFYEEIIKLNTIK